MLLNIHPDNPDQRKMQMAVNVLQRGGLVIYPTDSVYAVACLLNQSKSLEKLARFKKIKADKTNFSIICHDLGNISEYARNIENNVFKIMKKSLPGPYTFILNASSKIPSYFNANKKTVGIRVPDNNIARQIVKMLGNPILSTSIHDDDEIIEYSTDPELIHEKYKDQVDIVIDGGYGENIPSTVVDCTTGDFDIVREGKGDLELYL